MIEQNRMIIVEGPQGTGKSRLAGYLRDNIPASTLQRLSGQRDKTASGKQLSVYMYKILLDYLEKMSIIPMDLIFDRMFFTEEVYGRLGYKEYSFTDCYWNLVERLERMNYEIYLMILYLERPEIYLERLQRDTHHNYQAFSIQNSMEQQVKYLELAEELENTSIHVKTFAMDDFSQAYKEVDKVFKIGSKTRITKEQIGRK